MADDIAERFSLAHDIKRLGGNNNSGAVLHLFGKQHKTVLKVFEKRVPHEQEVAFYRTHYRILEASAVNVPCLLGIERVTETEWAIFTQAIEGFGHKPDLTPDQWFSLGGYLAEIAFLRIPNLQRHRNSRPFTDNDITVLSTRFNKSREQAICRSISRQLLKIKNMLVAVPLASGHMDLTWNNMAVPGEEFVDCPFVFDWGDMGLVHLGADLHFFIDRFKAETERQLFIEGYTTKINTSGRFDRQIDPREIMFSALTTGILTRLQWCRSHEKRGRKKEFEAMLQSLRRFLILFHKQLKNVAA